MKGHHAPAFGSVGFVSPPSVRAQRRTAARLLFLLLPACLLLPGCTTGRGNGGGASAGSANVLRYALTTEPTTLDPALVEDGTTIDLLQQIYEGLVQWNEKNEVAPNLAEKWDISPDGKTYTFHLKHGIKFQNGREVTADDFAYSLDRACDPNLKSPTAPTYLKDIVGVPDRIAGKAKTIAGIKVVDPYTLQITTDAFKPYWLGDMTYPTGYVVCKEVVEVHGGKIDETDSVGTGPFKLGTFRRGYEVTLTAFDGYHDGRPKLDGIDRPIIKDATTRLNKYEAGELDYVQVSPRDLDHINSDPNLKSQLKLFPRPAIWYLGLNQVPSGSPFGDKRVRQAFAEAIDKADAVRVALKDTVDVANSILPPEVPGYNPNIKPLPHDPAHAKQLLAQAGYPGGKGFPLLTFSFRQDQPEVGETAQVIARQLKTNLNVSVQLRPMEWTQFLHENDQKSMPFFQLRWEADYLDPQDFLSTMLHTDRIVNGQQDHPENGVGYSNPQFDALCDQADVEHDSKKRLALYQQAEQIAVDDAPWIPLYFQKDLILIKPRVKNLRNSAFGFLPYVTTTVTP